MRCGGPVLTDRTAAGNHEKKCRRARPWEREFYAALGKWPRKKDSRATVLRVPGNASPRLSVANKKVFETEGGC